MIDSTRQRRVEGRIVDVRAQDEMGTGGVVQQCSGTHQSDGSVLQQGAFKVSEVKSEAVEGVISH